MKKLRDLQLYAIVSECNEYKAIEAIYGMETTLMLFDMICLSHKNIAFQSAAMRIGLCTGDRGTEAFHSGAQILIHCKDMGLYELKHSETSIWIKPSMQFDSKEHFLLDPMNFETHEKPDPILRDDNHDLILSKFSQQSRYPVNTEFLNKINGIPYTLDMDIINNFAGDNMPITYNKVIADYLGNDIYHKWRYDSRGRSYPEGYGINIQGNKTVRAILNFKETEVINDPDPIYIALANARGFDDWTWERRIKWAKKQDIGYNFQIPKNTKYPERYAKAVRAMLDYQEGNPTGYMMELDATASGIQIMAAITGCMVTGKEVNLVDKKSRRDVYKTIARGMSQTLPNTVTRDEAKYPAMTHYYNSLATPKDIFDEAELNAFYEVLDGKLPGAEFCMERLNKCWNPKAKHHSWVLPDGHTAFVRTMTSKSAKYTYDGVEVDYMYYVNEGNKTSYRSLVPNIIHSIDGYIARQMVLRAKFQMVHVHDCFLFHPNHFYEVKQLYREILAELVTDYNINHIIESLTGKQTNIKVDTKLQSKIMKSEYALS